MTPWAVFQAMHALGVTLQPYPDGTLHYTAPRGVLTPALLDAIRQHKAALLALVEAFEERAAILEYCGGLSRVDAERLAWEAVEEQEQTGIERLPRSYRAATEKLPSSYREDSRYLAARREATGAAQEPLPPCGQRARRQGVYHV